MKKYRLRPSQRSGPSALDLTRQPELPENEPDMLWREWLWSETPAAGQPIEDLRQFCEEHRM